MTRERILAVQLAKRKLFALSTTRNYDCLTLSFPQNKLEDTKRLMRTSGFTWALPTKIEVEPKTVVARNFDMRGNRYLSIRKIL